MVKIQNRPKMEVVSFVFVLFAVTGGVAQEVCTSPDTEPPTCPPLNNIIESIPLGYGGTSVTWMVEPFPTDNCDPNPMLIDRTHQPGSFFDTGSTNVEYIFKDNSDNQVTCSFTIRIVEGDIVSTPSRPIVENTAVPSTTSGSSVASYANSITLLLLLLSASIVL